MFLPKDTCMYKEFRIPQRELLDSVLQLLDDLELEVVNEKCWIIKINGSLFNPDDGDLLTFWPSGDEGKDIITQYCKRVEKRNFFMHSHLIVKLQLGLYVDDLESLNPVKYSDLINLLRELEEQQKILLAQIN